MGIDQAKLHDLLIQELEDFAVFLIDRDGRITSWNPGVQRFLGYSEEEFIGMNVDEIFTSEDRAAGIPQAEIAKATTTGRASDVRWHLRKGLKRVFVEGVLIAIKDDTGAVASFAKIARAVHPQNVAASSMIASILDGTDDAIYVIDRSGRFVFANSQAARLFGRSLEKVVGHTWEEIVPRAAAELRAIDASVMGGTSPRVIEERFSTGEGERVFLTTKAPWRDTVGNALGLVAIAKDITNRKAFEKERERLLREVRRSNEELGAFSHVVAHDLRAPLRAVKMYAELLDRQLQGRLEESGQQFITFITEGAERMERLIESLLRYAESGEELAPSRVNTNAVIDGLIRTLDPFMEKTEATVTRDALPEVEADPVRLLQLFQNLIVNAIQYRRSEAPRVHISAEKSAAEYRFAVADNGSGIESEHFERIFMPMKRLQSSKDIPGSGIGLALCRKIVERHGGRMWVESQVGRGSTFFFTLPVFPEKRAM
jgi:PAS domain S-box-containing protein